MKYVYIRESLLETEHFYAGITDDVPARLTKHNAGEVPHTSKYRPWRIKTNVASVMKSKLSRSRNSLSQARVGHSQRKRL
jgi:predicted GIY-YIG superfamily endonuclease